MIKIKFGTDGWRAIIADEYTVENVARVSIATAIWVKENFENPKIVIGHDCRFAGELFAETACKVFASYGVKVIIAKGFVSTPMISLATVKEKASLGVVITASHNPPAYNGFKLKGSFGGPLSPEDVQVVEDMIPEKNHIDLKGSMEDLVASGLVEYQDLETMYVQQVEANFDLDLIRKSGLKFAFDAMYGAGQNVMSRILPECELLHCEHNPTFYGQAPEPIAKNLVEFSELIKSRGGEIAAGLAIDGDADRIGLFNSKGEFVDSHHIMLLLMNYLHKVKGLTGKIVVAASTTPRVERLAKMWGLDFDMVKIGFKYIAGQMITENVLVGGEESGGIAVSSHIPERDGIWMGLILFEYMAKSGKTLEALVEEIYSLVGEFKYWRDDLHLAESVKQDIIIKLNNGVYKNFGKYEIQKVETIDGFKFILNDDEWLMIRPSGTEPVLRAYAESKDLEGAKSILKAVKETLGIA